MVREHAYANSGARIALDDKFITILTACRLPRRLTRRQIREPQLDALLALPAVDSDLASGVHSAATVFQQRLAKRLADGTEGDRVHELSIAGTKARADVVLTNRIGIGERMRRQRQQSARDCPHRTARRATAVPRAKD